MKLRQSLELGIDSDWGIVVLRRFLVLSLVAGGSFLPVACGGSAGASIDAPSDSSSAFVSSGAPSQPGEELNDAAGAVVKVGEIGFGLVPDMDPGTRYAPTNLADEFRNDGLRVVFSGVVEEIPRGVRMWGTPLRLTSIRVLEAPEP